MPVLMLPDKKKAEQHQPFCTFCNLRITPDVPAHYDRCGKFTKNH